MKKKIIISVVIVAVIALVGCYIWLRIPKESTEYISMTTATGDDSIVITIETTKYRDWLLSPHWESLVSWGDADMLRCGDQYEFPDEYASTQYTYHGVVNNWDDSDKDKIVEQTILKLFEIDGKKICALYVIVSDRAESDLLFIGPSESAEESQALFELIDETYGDVDYYGKVYLTD